MTKKTTFILIFSLLVYFSFGQNHEKLSPAFRFFKERQLSKSQNSSVPSLFKKAESKKTNLSDGTLTTGYNCIIYTKSPEVLKSNGIAIQSTQPTFVTAWLSLDQILKLETLPEVDFIDTPKILKKNNDISVASTGASLLHAGRLDNTAYKGDGVIVAIIDTGIDWDHLDFRNPTDATKSRILRIWDQTLTPLTGESAPAGYSVGVEYTQAQINNEIDGTPAGFVREKDTDGHGTHVAGTAAGNGAALSAKYSGLAPKADIVIVKAGNGSFDTNNLILALDYLKNLATSLGKPIVVNMSLGSQNGAHDGTDPLEVAIDSFTDSAAGRMVVVAAGNENGDNLHKQIALAANATTTINLQVPTTTDSTSQDVFEFTLYANDTSAVSASVTAPDGTKVTVPTNSGLSIFGGKAKVYMSNYIDSAESGNRKIQVYLTRTATTTDVSGTWTISLTNTTSNAITLDGWLDTKGDDFANISLTGGDSNYLVGTPGSATKAITVGSYMAKINWYGPTTTGFGGYNYNVGTQETISPFSSIGPRRDNVIKPDITANGQAVVSCLSSDSGLASTDAYMVVDGLYRVEQGTSMATPAVTGCIALLLQKKSAATFTEIKSAITSTATKDSYTGLTDNATWGSGKIDVFKAASSFSYCQPLSRTIYSYDLAYGSSTNRTVNTNSNRLALRFSPTASGNLGGIFFETGTTVSLNSFTIELRNNNAGTPGTLVGSLAVTSSQIAKYTWNYFDLSGLNAAITSGTDYFIVLAPGSGDSFSLGQESTSSGRSYYSSNGTNWTATTNWRIRPVVYGTPPVGIPAITLTSAAGTDAQNLCTSTAITPITYTTTGVTGATFLGLPIGVNGVWNANTATISGTPSQVGMYNYYVKITSGCDTVTAAGTLLMGVSPTISSIAVTSGNLATTVTINGNNFLSSSVPTVTIGGTSATVVSATNTKVVVTLPANSTGGNVIVTNSCNLSSAPFVYPYVAPTNIILSTTTANDNNLNGATIATLSTTDADVGDQFTYSLVNGTGSTDNASFTITNANLNAAVVFNSAIKSSYSIRVRVADAGGLSFEKTFQITIIVDEDSDGVPNSIDKCPNTASGVKVDFNGCELFLLPSNNYAVMATATSCVGQQNGAISVSATDTNYTYKVTINGQNGFELNSANGFKNQTQNMAPGTYEICITILAKPNYSQCYTLKITEPTPLSATNKISTNGKQVTYSLSEASSYLVTLNGNTQTYSSNTITLDLVPGQNNISIATDLYCQGTIIDVIFVTEKTVFYPNPVKEKLVIYCSGTDKEVNLTLTDILGKTNTTTQSIPENRIIELNTSSDASGLYLIHLEGKTINETIKVIKQ